MKLPHRAEAFGLDWRSDIALDGFEVARGTTNASDPVDVHRVEAFGRRDGGRAINRGFVHENGVRFFWGDEVAFDMIEGRRVAYLPGPGWSGTMPACFYGTVAALTAAWRGMVPLHASAVEIGGRAILIAGAAGAGKSTLTAGLVALGARFVGDDLTVVAVEDGRVRVTRGRPTIRLHADTAARLDVFDARPVDGDPRGKWIARPIRRAGVEPLVPQAIVLLGGNDTEPTPVGIGLFAHLYRRRWLTLLPMREQMIADVRTIATTVPIRAYPCQSGFDEAGWLRWSEGVANVTRAVLDSGGGDKSG